MIRYLRLYARFVEFSLMRAMEFRIDFFFRIIMDVIYYAINISFFEILFLHTPILGGWTEPQVLIFVSGYLLIDAIFMTAFANNMWMLPMHVNKGDLDYYLLRPVSSLFFLSLRDFAVSSFINLIMAIGIMIWAFRHDPEKISALRVVLFLFWLGNGLFLYYLLRLVSILPVFWTHSGRGFDALFWTLARFMERPDRIYTGVMRVLLTTLLPFALIASFPSRILFGDTRPVLWFELFAVTLCFSLGVLVLWRKALASYSSASS
jgi:ABC-2 type transport system permease protein